MCPFNTCCFTQTLLAKLAHDAGPEMTVMGRRACSSVTVSAPLWVEMETLKDKMTHTAKPRSQGSCNNGHKAQLIFSYLSSVLGQKFVYSSASWNTSMQKDCYCISAAAVGVNHKRPDDCVNLHISPCHLTHLCQRLKKKLRHEPVPAHDIKQGEQIEMTFILLP